MDWGVVAGDHATKIARGPETLADTLLGGFNVPVDPENNSFYGQDV
jgi:hypothetical protein